MRAHAVRACALVLGAAILLGPSLSAAQGWQPVEPMPTARAYHAGATAGDRWYVAGGVMLDVNRSEQFPAEVDAYDPNSGHWKVLGELAQGRDYVVAVADPSQDRVLFPGGFLPAGPDGYLALATCDLATRDGVSPAPNLLGARHLHSVAHAAGKFVVSGGWGMESTHSKLLGDAETWDGTSSSWVAAGTMPAGPRSGHTMTTLKSGREVLVVGGGTSDHALAAADLFDASKGTWSTVAPPNVPRARHRSVLLDDGRVLVAGGDSYPSPTSLQNSAEIFDPATGRWQSAASMKDQRYDFDMVSLPDGRVLVAGGSNNATDGNLGVLSSAEVYDPAADAWTSLPAMSEPRLWPVLAVLSDGVYVAGGMNASTVLASVERLGWSDLGITGPIGPDAGATDGSSPDSAEPSDGGMDATTPNDAATDAGHPRDGDTDVAEPNDAAMDTSQTKDASADTATPDAGSSDRVPVESPKGCSCALYTTTEKPSIQIAFAWLALCAVFIRRSRRLQKSGRAFNLAACVAAISTVSGCCGVALPGSDGRDGPSSGNNAATRDAPSPACQYDAGDGAITDASQSVKAIVVGGGYFSEPTNGGYVSNISPTWNAGCFLISSQGHLRASVTTTFAGNAPNADQHKDVLFWNVWGSYPPLDPELAGVLSLPLSEIAGVVSSSSSSAGSPFFALDGSFDPTVPSGAGSGPLSEIFVGFTWVRVYRKDGALEYQVFPGRPGSDPSPVMLDQPADLAGTFEYYAPLADDPSLGKEFDYPSWIRAHVTW